MALSYLVAEHNEDSLVVVDTEDDDYVNTNANNNNVHSDNDNDHAMTDSVMEEMRMMVEDEDPFDVQAASSTDGSTDGNRSYGNKPPSTKGTAAEYGQAVPPQLPPPRQNLTRARTPTNEVGELPTLSMSRSESAEQHQMFHRTTKGSGVVTGGRATRVRPLSPPSRAGLDHPKVYNSSKRDQSGRNEVSDDDDDDGQDDGYYDGGAPPQNTSKVSSRHRRTMSEEEMPMDEQKEYIEHKNATALALCGVDDPTNNFCNTTFTAMEEMCGIADSKKMSSDGNSALPLQQTLALGEKHTLAYAAGVEEQTAIEVEYVEPIYRGRNGEDDMYSPKRKNALLKAMAKKALDDFKSRKTPTPTSSEKQEARSVALSDYDTSSSPAATENIYGSFSPSEKRKFLQLINGGMSPINATEQVIRERQPSTSSTGGNAGMADGVVQVPIRGNKDFSDSGPKEVVSPTQSVSSTGPTPSPQKKRGLGLAFWKRGKDKQNKVAETSSSPRTAAAAATTNNSIPMPTSSPSRRYVVREAEIVDDEAESEGRGFAKSGISYYDAVRKEHPNDEEDDDGSPNRKSNTGRLSLPKFSKGIFSKLVRDEQDQSGEAKQTTSQLETIGRDQMESAVRPQMQIPALSKESQQLQHGESDDGDDDGGEYEGEEESAYDGDGGYEDDDVLEGVPEDEAYEHLDPVNEAPKTRSITNPGETFRPILMPTEGNNVGGVGSEILPAMSDESLLDDTDAPEENDINYYEEKKADHDEGQAIEDETAARILGVTGVAAGAGALSGGEARRSQGGVDTTEGRDGEHEVQEPKRRNKQIELDMDTYLNSTESTSRGSFDHTSVVSGKSYKTSLTAGTNHTQSTRTRRPGQAKARLESEKSKAKTQTKVIGWQESIQAVAASTGKEWDPAFGWKDYVDPKPGDDLGDQYVADSISVNLDRLKQAQGNQDASTATSELLNETESVSVARVTQVWDAEQNVSVESVYSERIQSIATESMYSEQAPMRQHSKPVRRSKSPKVARSPKSGQPRGWVETMKLATANLSVDGKHWNAERGWVGIDEKDFGGHDAAERAYLDQVAITAESDTQDFGTIHIPHSTGHPGGEEKTAAVVQLDAIADNQDSGLQFLSEDEEQVTEDDHDSTSKSNGRYVQIADTGSVRSHYRNPPMRQTHDQQTRQQLKSMEEEQEHSSPNAVTAPIIQVKSGTGSVEDRENDGYRSVLVNVKKQELDEADASYFTQTDPMNGGRGPVYMDDAEGDTNQINEERASGPIDLDEVYEQDNREYAALETGQPKELGSNESFGGNSDFSWDAEDSANQVQHKKPVPRLRINIRESGSLASGPHAGRSTGPQSEASLGSVSSVSKSIPKLSGPRRDTSPVRGRKSESSKSVRSASNLSDSGTTDSTVPAESSLSESKNNQDDRAVIEESPKAQLSPELVATFNQGEVENVSGDFGLSFYTKESEVPTLPSDHAAIVAAATAALGDDDSSSPRVRDLHNYWEARSTGSSSGFKVDAQSSEWKAFLAKKVKSDAAAAAATGRRDRSRKSEVDDEDDRDTIFDFNESEGAFPTVRKRGMGSGRPGEPQEGAFEDISDLSPIRHDESDSDFVPSEASTNIQHGGTFLQRLQACAAPIVTRSTENCGPSMPMAAHLAFLRSNPNVVGTQEKSRVAGGASGNVGSLHPPAGLCGRPAVIAEEDSEEVDDFDESEEAAVVSNRRMEIGGAKKRSPKSSLSPVPRPDNQRSRSNPKSRQSNSSDVSSVISDEFGAKTAYFEALAMKAAVGSKKKRRSPGSEVSSSSGSKHSDKFQQFLDRRASKGDSTDLSEDQQLQQQLPSKKPPTGREEVTARAERYASEKVEEMMDSMAGRNNLGVPLDYRGRPLEEETGAFPTLPRPVRRDPGIGTNSARLAAEELAAARVEAMMQSLSARNAVDEEEGEI
jgi:hypothetical protein